MNITKIVVPVATLVASAVIATQAVASESQVPAYQVQSVDAKGIEVQCSAKKCKWTSNLDHSMKGLIDASYLEALKQHTTVRPRFILECKGQYGQAYQTPDQQRHKPIGNIKEVVKGSDNDLKVNFMLHQDYLQNEFPFYKYGKHAYNNLLSFRCK